MLDKFALIFSAFELPETEAPAEIDLLTEATYRGYKKPGSVEITEFIVTAEHLEAAAAHFKARRAEHPERDLVIDYEHATWQDREAPAAGWIEDIFTVARDGKKVLRARIKMWTERAKEYLRNKEYRYLSPVFALNAVDKKSGEVFPCIFYNAGITNEPLIDELQPIVSSFNFQKTIKGKDTVMDELLERLRSFLGLPTTATAAEITAELEKLIDQIKEKSEGAEEVTAQTILAELERLQNIVTAKSELAGVLGLKPESTLDELKAAIIAAKTGADSMQQLQVKVETIETQVFEREFDRVIAKGVTEGRILPVQKSNETWMNNQRQWAKGDFAGFETYYAKSPIVGPMQRIPTGDLQVAAKGITSEDVEMGAKLGVSKEILEKHATAII